MIENCAKCGNNNKKVNVVLKDANREIVLCRNCMTAAFLNNELVFENDPNLIDDISGRLGAIQFISCDESYCLEKRTMMRLVSYNLQKHEYQILAGKYGADKFMLHDDFYSYGGESVQSLLDMLD